MLRQSVSTAAAVLLGLVPTVFGFDSEAPRPQFHSKTQADGQEWTNDVHAKFSKEKQSELLAEGKPLEAHFRLYAVTEEAGGKMLDRSVWDPRLNWPVPREKREPVDYVDPWIDSAHSRWIFFASACRPFGMVNLSPDTDTKGWWNSGYCYHTGSICGLNHVHAWQLSGPSVMPLTGPVRMAAGSDFCRSKFRHESEIVRAGYHALTLDDYGVRVELTSTDRVGMHRYTFPKSPQSGALFNLGSGSGPSPIAAGMLRKVGDRRLQGFVTNGPTLRRPKPCAIHFAAEFDTPFQSIAGWADGKDRGEVAGISGKDVKAIAWFSTTDQQVVQLKVGLSYVSIEQAGRNLQAEVPHWDFDRVRRESRHVWNRWLGKIEVEGGTEAQRTKFYTDLWHVLLGRRLTSDVDGKYCDRTGQKPVIRQVPLAPDGRPQYHHYNSDAFWNTFWNINQVWGPAHPDVARQFVSFLLDMYRNGGLIPRGPAGNNYSWVMIASHSTPLIVGAAMKGIDGFDLQTAYEGTRKNVFPGGAVGHGHYEHNSAERGDGGWGQSLSRTDRVIKNAWEVLSPLNQITAATPLDSHEFLAPDRLVQRTRFGDVTITVAYEKPAEIGDNAVPAYGFIVESPRYIAFCATRYNGMRYHTPTLFTVRSLDGKPIPEPRKVRIYHGFGDPWLRLFGKTFEVQREETVGASRSVGSLCQGASDVVT